MLDYLYIDVTAVPGLPRTTGTRAASAAAHGEARAARLVDHARRRGAEAAGAGSVVPPRWRTRRRAAAPIALGAFRAFQPRAGRRSRVCGVRGAARALLPQRGQFSWRDWPAPMRDPRLAGGRGIRRARMPSASSSSSSCNGRRTGSSAPRRRRGATAGCRSGSTATSRSGSNPNGAEAWADQELVVAGRSDRRAARPAEPRRAGLGSRAVQPAGAAAARLRPVYRTLRANMRHAGMLRIDQ